MMGSGAQNSTNKDRKMVNSIIFPNVNALAQSAAEHFCQNATAAIQTKGMFTVALSGGSTPVHLYQLLATDSFRHRVDWAKIHFFWGDERCVPPDHPDSNYLSAWENLLSKAPVPQNNIHRILAEQNPNQAAAAYEETLRSFFSKREGDTQAAGVDLCLLGMGEDGHTASLFPGTPVIFEKTHWVRPVFVEKLSTWRITLTAPFLRQSSKIIFLVTGSNKSQTLQKVLHGPYQPEQFPSQLIADAPCKPLWLLDEEAAALI